ncbi:hypothetical protein MCEMSEM23_00887 [Rhabdaerophilaceae bacterium]
MTPETNSRRHAGAAAGTDAPSTPIAADVTRGWRFAALMLVITWLVLGWPWLSGSVTIPWDAKAHFHAQVSFLAQSLHRGDSPFWAPFVFAGHPQISDPQSLIFSPPHMLLALWSPMPSLWAVDVVTFLGLLFGAFGVLGFARDRRWHVAAGVVAAITFAYGGSASWRVQHTGQIFSMLYFPWALWMLERALRLQSKRYGALAGLFAALIALDPDQVAFLTILLLGTYVLFYWGTHSAQIRQTAPAIAVMACVGIAIIALPTAFVLSFAENSNRPHFTIAEAEMGSLHPSNLLTFVVANLFGTIGPADDFWGAPSVHWPYIVSLIIARNMSNFYMGLLPFLAVLYWLTSAEAYARRFAIIGITFILMVVYALGKYTPVFAMLYNVLPGVSLFRRPADSLFLVGSLGSILTGFGLNRLLVAPALPRWQIGFITLVIAMAFAGSVGMAIWMKKLGQSGGDILIASGFVLVTLSLLWVVRNSQQGNPLTVAALLCALMVADFGWNVRPSDSTGLSPRVYDILNINTENLVIRDLKNRIVRNETRRDRVELTGVGFEWPNAGLVHQFENTLGYNPLRLSHYAIATGAGDTVAGVDQHRFAPLFPSYRSPFANLIGLRFLVLGAPIEQVDPRMRNNPLPMLAQYGQTYIYENPDTLPRVLIAKRAEIVDQARLTQFGDWPGTDFHAVAYIEQTSQPLPVDGGGSARILHYANTEIRIAVESPKGGVLLLNDVWHPWWVAEIDGKPVPVLRTNGVFRSVILPPGASNVVFRFAPLRGLLSRLKL